MAPLATEAIGFRAAAPTASPTVADVGRVPVGRLLNRPELKRLFRHVHASEGPDLDAVPAPAAALLPVSTVAVPPWPVILIEAAPCMRGPQGAMQDRVLRAQMGGAWPHLLAANVAERKVLAVSHRSRRANTQGTVATTTWSWT